MSQTGGAKSGALLPDFGPIDPDLQRLIAVWETLPDPLREGIAAMIGNATKGKRLDES